MARFLTRRGIQALITIVVILTIAFILVHLAGKPGALLVPDGTTAAGIDKVNQQLGYNDPILVQYWNFILSVLSGTFGTSFTQDRPAIDIVMERLPATIELALLSFGIGIGLAFVASFLLHISQTRWAQAVLVWLGSVRQAVPDFLFAVILVLVFSVSLGVLPSLGDATPLSIILPVATLATAQFALYFRLFNASFGEQVGQDYVRTAYAKGQSHAQVVMRQMLPNAMLPILTVAGLNLGALLGGTVIVEQVFSWPGLGTVLLTAVSTRDFPVVQAGLLVIALIFIIVNLIVDLAYAVLDPRVRFS
jgi:peptide/nickel transport system permease protein